METITQLYSTHPFAVTLAITLIVSLLFIKIISLISKIAIVLSLVGLGYYFFAMTPEAQIKLNTEVKDVLSPIVGKIKEAQPEGLAQEIKKKYEETIDKIN